MAVNAENLIRLPNNWKPRFYQQQAWDYLSNDGKRAVLCWPRRSGKDDLSLHHTACAAHERVGGYIHLLPIYAQARKAIWDAVNETTGIRRIDEAFPQELRAATREHEMMIVFKNGSTWQIGGTDSYDSLVGTSYVGMVFSEYALSSPSAWGYFSPILMNNNGWAIFISTPRGKNHMYDMYQMSLQEKDWFSQKLTNDDTLVFTADQMRQELVRLQRLHGDQYGEALWRQEYFTSFDAAIPGSIWGDCVEAARVAGRISSPPLEPNVPVYTGWDLGFSDSTAVWFYQLALGEIRVIDYYEDHGKSIEFYADMLKRKAKERSFKYGTHWLPHDARPRTLAAGGKSILDQMQEQLQEGSERDYWGACQIAPRLDREEGIQAARATFPHCWFDGERCADGIEKLRQYHREWDDEKKVFSMNPCHDASSHAADGWRTVAVTWKYLDAKQPGVGWHEKLTHSGIRHDTFGDLKKRHLSKARAAREEAAP